MEAKEETLNCTVTVSYTHNLDTPLARSVLKVEVDIETLVTDCSTHS